MTAAEERKCQISAEIVYLARVWWSVLEGLLRYKTSIDFQRTREQAMN